MPKFEAWGMLAEVGIMCSATFCNSKNDENIDLDSVNNQFVGMVLNFGLFKIL